MVSTKILPSTGVRVLGIGNQIASMTPSMILADMGATATQICLEGTENSPHVTDALRAVMNRNKMVVTLHVKEDYHKIIDLIDHTDILIGAFSEKKFKELGFDFEALPGRHRCEHVLHWIHG